MTVCSPVCDPDQADVAPTQTWRQSHSLNPNNSPSLGRPRATDDRLQFHANQTRSRATLTLLDLRSFSFELCSRRGAMIGRSCVPPHAQLSPDTEPRMRAPSTSQPRCQSLAFILAALDYENGADPEDGAFVGGGRAFAVASLERCVTLRGIPFPTPFFVRFVAPALGVRSAGGSSFRPSHFAREFDRPTQTAIVPCCPHCSPLRTLDE